MDGLLVTFLCLLASTSVVLGQELECYACSYNEDPNAEPYCVTDPNHPSINPGTVKCDRAEGRGCYVKGQFDKATQSIRSFQRGCEIFHHIPEGCTESTHFHDCLTMCYDDFCNSNSLFTTPEPFTGSTEDGYSGGETPLGKAWIVLIGLICGRMLH